MPTKTKDAEIAVLVDAMLMRLESLRQTGGEVYPPRLRQLAALTGRAPSDDEVRKAASKKGFTDRAVVTGKVDRKPSLDSPVYFKEDAPAKRGGGKTKPPKPDPSQLAARMRAVLDSQRRLGADAYPPTLRRLAELCDLKPSDAAVAQTAGHETMTSAAIVAAKAGKKPLLDAPVVLRHDLADFQSLLPALLRFVLAPTVSKASESTAFTLTDVKGRVVQELQAPLLRALEQGAERRDLPAGVVWVVVKKKPYFALAENLRPGPAQLSANGAAHAVPDDRPTAPVREAPDFRGAFRESFDRLDRHNGGTNFVKLADLRRALARFSREEFDAGLRALRVAGEFALDSHEGLYGSLTPEERDAGVRELGSLLVYVSRR